MADPDLNDLAVALQGGLSLLVRRLRQLPAPGDLSLSERSALSRLDRDGPATAAALARAEQITPQSMGATLAGLEGRALVQRTADPADGRRHLLSVTDAGRELLRSRRDARAGRLAEALAGCSRDEIELLAALAPVLERLAGRL